MGGWGGVGWVGAALEHRGAAATMTTNIGGVLQLCSIVRYLACICVALVPLQLSSRAAACICLQIQLEREGLAVTRSSVV